MLWIFRAEVVVIVRRPKGKVWKVLTPYWRVWWRTVFILRFSFIALKVWMTVSRPNRGPFDGRVLGEAQPWLAEAFLEAYFLCRQLMKTADSKIVSKAEVRLKRKCIGALLHEINGLFG
jgi:hypothetical protein